MKEPIPPSKERSRFIIWIVLTVGMVAIMLVAVWNKGFAPTQLAWLVASCLALAGICTWIIGWE